MSKFDGERLLALSTAISRLLSIEAPEGSVASTVIGQMIREGIRKLHDTAEHDGRRCKYLGHRHWSSEARELLKKHGGHIRGAKHGLRHEHVVPVKEVVKLLRLCGSSPSVEDIQAVIEQMSIVAIITVEEDRDLSGVRRDFETKDYLADRWVRYREPLHQSSGVPLIKSIDTAPELAAPFEGVRPAGWPRE